MPTPTFEYKLSRCKLEPWPVLRPMNDLAENALMTRTILERINPFYGFTWSLSRFSGYAAEASEGALFYVQFWTNANKLWRSAAFRNIGYAGVLHVERLKKDESDVDFTIDRDFVEELIDAIGEQRILPNQWAETCMPVVDGTYIELPVPWRAR